VTDDEDERWSAPFPKLNIFLDTVVVEVAYSGDGVSRRRAAEGVPGRLVVAVELPVGHVAGRVVAEQNVILAMAVEIACSDHTVGGREMSALNISAPEVFFRCD
jgi:hypothetical protein